MRLVSLAVRRERCPHGRLKGVGCTPCLMAGIASGFGAMGGVIAGQMTQAMQGLSRNLGATVGRSMHVHMGRQAGKDAVMKHVLETWKKAEEEGR